MDEHFQFSQFELNKEIDEIVKDNPFNAEDIKDNRFLISEAYRKAARYYNNKGIYEDYAGHQTILGYVVGDILKGLTPRESVRYMSMNKHTQYFENFVGAGSTVDIQDALLEYGFSLDDLKGLRYADDNVFYSGGGRIKVIQKWVKDINGSPYLESFEIFIDGRKVYSNEYKEEEPEEYYVKPETISLDDRIEEFKRGNIGVASPLPNKKGQINSYGLETQFRNGHTISIRITKKGRVFAYDETTHKFAKVKR